MKRNAILVWANSDGDIFNEPLMTYMEAYKLMKILAVSHWLASQNLAPDFEDDEIEIYIHSNGICVSAYSATVWVDSNDVRNWKIIII